MFGVAVIIMVLLWSILLLFIKYGINDFMLYGVSGLFEIVSSPLSGNNWVIILISFVSITYIFATQIIPVRIDYFRRIMTVIDRKREGGIMNYAYGSEIMSSIPNKQTNNKHNSNKQYYEYTLKVFECPNDILLFIGMADDINIEKIKANNYNLSVTEMTRSCTMYSNFGEIYGVGDTVSFMYYPATETVAFLIRHNGTMRIERFPGVANGPKIKYRLFVAILNTEPFERGCVKVELL